MTWVIGYSDTIDATLQNNKGGRVKYVDGKPASDWKKGPTLAEALKTAGQEGWELVAIYPSIETGYTKDPTWVFKRPSPLG